MPLPDFLTATYVQMLSVLLAGRMSSCCPLTGDAAYPRPHISYHCLRLASVEHAEKGPCDKLCSKAALSNVQGAGGVG